MTAADSSKPCSINPETKAALVGYLCEAGTLMLALRKLIPLAQDNGSLDDSTPLIESAIQKTGALIDRCLQDLGDITVVGGPSSWLQINRKSNHDRELETRRGQG